MGHIQAVLSLEIAVNIGRMGLLRKTVKREGEKKKSRQVHRISGLDLLA